MDVDRPTWHNTWCMGEILENYENSTNFLKKKMENLKYSLYFRCSFSCKIMQILKIMSKKIYHHLILTLIINEEIN